MFAISPTDIDWFNFLRSSEFNSEINFWTPTPWNVKGLKPGERLYFMLKSPIRKIGGFGYFKEYANMSVHEAWNKFGYKNGCKNKQELIDRLDKYKSTHSKDEKSVEFSEIGCIVLSSVACWDDNDFKEPSDYEIDFPINIVKIKYFDQDDPFSKEIETKPDNFTLINETKSRSKKSRLVTERKGQGIFRSRITKAYDNKCCITGESTPELIEAAHIQPYINESSNHVKNGLLLRVDLHKMFDNGLLYIDETYKVRVSSFIKSEYYRSLNGIRITLPNNRNSHPSLEALTSRLQDFRNE